MRGEVRGVGKGVTSEGRGGSSKSGGSFLSKLIP